MEQSINCYFGSEYLVSRCFVRASRFEVLCAMGWQGLGGIVDNTVFNNYTGLLNEKLNVIINLFDIIINQLKLVI